MVEMDRLAAALTRGDREATADVLAQGRRRLQQIAVDELHRLVGELITEVTLAEDAREKVGRAIALGARLIDSQPPDSVVTQCADPAMFVVRCRAACASLVTFLTGALEEAMTRDEVAPFDSAREWVIAAIDDLKLALARTSDDGLDRKSGLAVSLVRALGISRTHGHPADTADPTDDRRRWFE
jgi:hypothetical protein